MENQLTSWPSTGKRLLTFCFRERQALQATVMRAGFFSLDFGDIFSSLVDVLLRVEVEWNSKSIERRGKESPESFAEDAGRLEPSR